jgi:hypothetical protein
MTFYRKLIDLFVLVVFIVLVYTCYILTLKNFKNEPLYVEDEFIPLFNDFKKDAAKHSVVPYFSGLTTSFVYDIGGDVLGYCVPRLNLVKISKKKWDTLSQLNRKLLMYHEWAHCTLKRDHTEDNGFLCPISIMHPYISPTSSCYLAFKEWYDRELFTNPNKTKLIDKENYETVYSTNIAGN